VEVATDNSIVGFGEMAEVEHLLNSILAALEFACLDILGQAWVRAGSDFVRIFPCGNVGGPHISRC
jgi:hypothetical protein